MMINSEMVKESIDYEMASLLSTLVNKPTKYKGHGRPRKSDYGIWEHPFDKKRNKWLNY